MTDQNSILDKIIESKKIQEATQFNPEELIADLFKTLSSKEKDILNRRFGLSGQSKETLEEIGKYYKITRERIRQIESGTVKKLKELNNFKELIKTAEHNISGLLENYGGIMEENHLLEELLAYSDQSPTNRQTTLFILANLLNDKIKQIKADVEIHDGWKLSSSSVDLAKNVLNELVDIINDTDQLLETKKLLQLFREKDSFKQHQDQILNTNLTIDESDMDTEKSVEKVINSYLTISKKINQNILGEWGLTHWNTVSPKRMGDKVYLVLRKIGKPLHFNKITELINEAGFDNKIAYPATIHNELILDDRYILVGRGIYALKEWGYNSGTVIDIVMDVISKSDEPLTKEEIIKRVLDQRIVRKSTILLALTNKEKIKRLPDGRYTVNKPKPVA